jgi:hypothetical protein
MIIDMEIKESTNNTAKVESRLDFTKTRCYLNFSLLKEIHFDFFFAQPFVCSFSLSFHYSFMHGQEEASFSFPSFFSIAQRKNFILKLLSSCALVKASIISFTSRSLSLTLLGLVFVFHSYPL